MKTLVLSCVGASLLAISGPAPLASPSARLRVPVREDKTDLAIHRAVGFLVTQQDKDGAIQGSWAWANRTAMTALSLMAMAAVGHQPADDSPEGRAMKKGLAFVLRPEHQDVDGYFGNADGSRMYGHGIITLMLAELLGMGADQAQDRQITDRCKAAIGLILSAQMIQKTGSDSGGWRYTPDSYDSDLSASVWQVLALRAAKNAGIEVPKGTIDNAVEYIKGCYHSPRGEDGKPDRPEERLRLRAEGRRPVTRWPRRASCPCRSAGPTSASRSTARPTG